MNKDAPKRPVQPRHSASVILVKHDRTGTPRVLMGKRPAKSRFVPDVFVFPGGGVEPQDKTTPALKSLVAPVATHLENQPGPTAATLATAAIRETWEETSLILGDVKGGTLLPDHSPLAFMGRAITPTDSPIRFHARFFMTDANNIPGTPTSNGELLQMDWFTIEEALKLPLIDITELMLARARTVLTQPNWSIQPIRFSYRRGKPYWVDDGAAYRFKP